MKRLLSIGLAFVSCGVMAQGNPCKEPEYLFIKSASKAEMRDEYCSLTRRAESNDAMRRITRESIQRKHELRLETSADREEEMSELKAATSCKVAAGAIADALSRRFKSKPPSCS
jgi:hypothetical protein